MGLFGKSKRQKVQDLYSSGSKGVGTVISVADTGMTINDNPRVKMAFRVEPLDGSAPLDLAKTTTVSRVEIPRQGDRYAVLFDPQDPGTWLYITVSDDTGRATLREMFGVAAESFVGMGGAPAAPVADGQDNIAALSRLAELHSQGMLTREEFESEKAKLLG